MGANDGAAEGFFNGVLDELAIYDTALDYDTIVTHFAVMAMGSTL